jgi:hypothetical protein
VELVLVAEVDDEAEVVAVDAEPELVAVDDEAGVVAVDDVEVVDEVEELEGVVEEVEEVVDVAGALCACAVLTARASMLAAQITGRRDPIMNVLTAASAFSPGDAVLSV